MRTNQHFNHQFMSWFFRKIIRKIFGSDEQKMWFSFPWKLFYFSALPVYILLKMFSHLWYFSFISLHILCWNAFLFSRLVVCFYLSLMKLKSIIILSFLMCECMNVCLCFCFNRYVGYCTLQIKEKLSQWILCMLCIWMLVIRFVTWLFCILFVLCQCFRKLFILFEIEMEICVSFFFVFGHLIFWFLFCQLI